MAKSDNAKEVGVHLFERAGLGIAPYEFIGYERKVYIACPGAQTQPGGSCHYCGTGIIDCFFLRSSDGKKFYVGCDCINKSGDSGIIKAYKNSREYRAIQKQKRDAKAKRVHEELNALMTSHADKLRSIPVKKWDGSEETKYDYLTRVIPMCGAAGQARYLKHVRQVVAA